MTPTDGEGEVDPEETGEHPGGGEADRDPPSMLGR